MKKLLLLFAIFTFPLCSAQEYIPLLDNLNEWHFTTCFSGCNTDVYYTDGDTIVDEKSYKILDGYHYISRTFLLREEISPKTVYLKIVESSGGNEYLLYDFSLNVGDSIDMKNPISPFLRDAGYFQVDSIINKAVANGITARHFYLSPTPSNSISDNNAVWIEGVGSLSLINAPGGFPDINQVGALSCSFKNGELFYSNLDSISGCEPVILNTGNFSTSLNNVNLNSLITDGICEMYDTKNVTAVDVFDINGKKLTSITNKGQNTLELEVSNFKAGFYFVVAASQIFEKKTFKIVVTK